MSGAAECTHGVQCCCEGTAVRTPVEVTNRAGLPAIEARVGTHAQFRDSMLARLSSATHPGLAGLRTREADDFSTALIDAWATVSDVLTFYQERIANEAYLRTATEALSVRELAAEIGYERDRGSAATVGLAFTVEAIGDPPRPIAIERGTRVLSVPGPGEAPQTFETVQDLEARAEWNVLHPQLTESRVLQPGDTEAYLEGIDTALRQGDALLFVRADDEGHPSNAPFEVRRVRTVTPEREAGRTRVTWDRPLEVAWPGSGPSLYALRQRASIFGHNAPDWRPMPVSMKASYLGIEDPENVTEAEKVRWPQYSIFAPRVPTELRAPVVIPTAKAVGKRALDAAQLAAEEARNAAFREAVATVLVLKAAVDAVVTAMKEQVGTLADIVESVVALRTTLKEILDGLVSLLGALGEEAAAAKAALEAKVEELKNGINDAIALLPDGPPRDILEGLVD